MRPLHVGVDRAVQLGNRVLKECRAHVKRHGDLAAVGLALAYVQAEFLAVTSEGDEARLDQGIAMFAEQMKGRAMERWPEIETDRRERKKGMN